MTYRTDNKIRKYLKGYGFMTFAKNQRFSQGLKNFRSKYGKKIMNKGISAASKFNQSNYGKMLKNQGSEFGKIAGKKILTKSAEATGDLIGSKIADKSTSFKSKPQEKIDEIIISPEKRQQILNDLRLF